MTKNIHIHVHTSDSLVSGGGKAALSKNIATEVRAGKPVKQAAAIAYSKQGETSDEQAHAPAGSSKGGQFVSGGGGGGSTANPAAKQKIASKTKPDITKHPQYTKADHEYLSGKGWTNEQISKRWDEEHKAGTKPQTVNKSAKPGQAGFASAHTGMTGDRK